MQLIIYTLWNITAVWLLGETIAQSFAFTFYKMFQAWISKFSVKKDNQQSLVTQYVPNSVLRVI